MKITGFINGIFSIIFLALYFLKLGLSQRYTYNTKKSFPEIPNILQKGTKLLVV